ncbi:MAG: NAD(P)/FAD-dependent oxidoreductase [Spirochaetia bacterium]|nr:NAD(P)/FAD-dependent oxidoreductase [Spirochaetia bacterium]
MALAIFAVAEGVPCNKEALQFFFGSPFVDGYGWIFPRDDDAVNIGFGIPARAAQGHSLRQRLLDFIFRNNPHAKIRTICGGKVPLHSVHRRSFAMHGLFKVGDAAGCVDPIWGSGISEALECGRIVGENIPDWLGKTDPEERRHLEDWVFDQWMDRYGYFYQKSARAKIIMNKITDDQWDIFLHHMSDLPQENQASVFETLNNSPWLWPIMIWEVCGGLKNKNFC